MANDALAPPCDIEAIQMRPERSWSATERKRPRMDLIAELLFCYNQVATHIGTIFKDPLKTIFVAYMWAIHLRVTKPTQISERFDNCNNFLNFPSSEISEYLFKRFVLGTLTLSNERRALSTPLRPILWPISLMVTPGIVWPATPSRIWHKMACTPCHSPSTCNCAKTTQCWAWSAPFVIQYLCASSVGVLIVIVSSSLL